MPLRSTIALASLLALTLTSASQAQTTPAAPPTSDAASPSTGAVYDPWEKLNRGMFMVSGALDIAVIRPVSIFYKRATPRPARDGVHNLVSNLGEPVIIINHVLQLKPKPAATTLGRFALNSTVGIGGLFDVASGAGLPERSTNFGQTMGRYGVGTGPYVFLPILGPSSVRDATGRIVDTVMNPFTWINFHGRTYFTVARTVAGGVDARVISDPALQYIQKNTTDPYAALRSAYQQNADFLEHGGKVDVKSLPDFGPEPAHPPAKPQ